MIPAEGHQQTSEAHTQQKRGIVKTKVKVEKPIVTKCGDNQIICRCILTTIN